MISIELKMKTLNFLWMSDSDITGSKKFKKEFKILDVGSLCILG